MTVHWIEILECVMSGRTQAHRGTDRGNRMLGLLKRHEVEILLKAGHRRTEVARLTGISPGSVRRIAGEASIEHFNDAGERRERRIGRPSIVEGFRKMISDILEKEAEVPSLEILRQV